MLFGQKTERVRLPEKPEELTGSLFTQEMDPAEQARLDKEAAKALAQQDKLVHVEAHDCKVRKPIDTSKLEVKEEHLYPELDNKDDYTEMAPEVTDSLVLVPKQMYIRRIIRHKFVLKSKLQVENPDRKAFEIAALPPAPLHKCMADASLLADIIISKYHYHLPFYLPGYRELQGAGWRMSSAGCPSTNWARRTVPTFCLATGNRRQSNSLQHHTGTRKLRLTSH